MIETKNLSYSYHSEDEENEAVKEEVLKELNLKIKKGSFTAILGSNGSGKSTLAKHFNAILLPSGGFVYVKGMNTHEQKYLFDIRSNVGMVFQNPDNQMVTAIVEDEIAFAPENLGVKPQEIRNRVDECLKIVGMQEYAGSFTANLSGGQKLRIAIASVLAMEPECIVLDEPTSMLDPKGRAEVLDTIKMLNRAKGITVVLITHYMEEAVMADRTIVIDNGKIVIDGVPAEVFKNVELLKKLKLDVPQVTELAYELKKLGFEISDGIIDVDECFRELVKLLGDVK
ncbi:MAG: energy-coupling factor transporter ATPase [Clostridia bacterium]|nr:energy-coupling factor transporter ATPase [Clostridia bacterium]